MSRNERERWKLAEERWPELQAFISGRLSETFGLHIKTLHKLFDEAVAPLSHVERQSLARECRDLMLHRAKFYDDRGLLTDGFGVTGKWEGFPQDHGYQPGLRRISMLYDLLIEAIRTEEKDWKP